MPRPLTLLLAAALLTACQPTPATLQGSVPASAPQAAPASPAPDLIRIDGRGFTQADLDFAGLMLKLTVLAQDADPAEQAAALKRLDNVNIRLDHVIERYAMSLLGQAKHYAFSEAQLGTARQAWQAKIDARPAMGQLIADYGPDRFTGRLREYLRQQLVRDRIIDDLLATERRKSPQAGARELDYNVAKAYDALYQDHAGDLDIQINLRGLPPRPTGASAPARPAPALHVRDGAGLPLPRPAPTAARPLLVNFWATWCAPCREELPLLLQAKASGRYDVLTVNLDESPGAVQAYLDGQQLGALPVAHAKAAQLPGWTIPGLPTTYLIGEGWTLRGQKFGPLTRADPWMQGL